MEGMVAEATTQRTKEHEQALIAVKKYQDAQSFLQMGGADPASSGDFGTPPPTFEGAYPAKMDAAGGVIGILEIAISDFAKLESETQTQEDVAQREYESLTQDSATRKAVSSKDLDYKTTTKVKLESSLQRLRSDLEGYTKELEAVDAYIEKLTPSCTTQGDTAEERKARREEEIRSLQEALQILNDEA